MTDKTQAEIERDLGLWRGCISGWKRQLTEEGEEHWDSLPVRQMCGVLEVSPSGY